MIEDCEKDDEQEIIKKHISMLMEHFSTVQIFVTKSNRDGTDCSANGAGEFYARMAYVREWMITQDERTRCFARDLYRQSQNGDS